MFAVYSVPNTTSVAAASVRIFSFFFNATATTEIYTLSLHDALPIPFGAVSQLLPLGERIGDDRLNTLRRAAALLAERGHRRPLVLAIDDAHLLDDASAALVHLLALRGLAVVLATVRTGAPAPDSVVALWKDGLARRLDLRTLAPEATAELLGLALDGPVDGVTRREVLR